MWAPDKEQQQKAAQKHFKVGKLDTFDWLFAGVGPLAKPKPTVYFIWAAVWATADDGEVLRYTQTIVLVSKAQCQSTDVHSFHITVLQHCRVHRQFQNRVTNWKINGRMF